MKMEQIKALHNRKMTLEQFEELQVSEHVRDTDCVGTSGQDHSYIMYVVTLADKTEIDVLVK